MTDELTIAFPELNFAILFTVPTPASPASPFVTVVAPVTCEPAIGPTLVRTFTPFCFSVPRKLLLPKNVWFAVFVPAGHVVAASAEMKLARSSDKVVSILISVFVFTKLP